MFSHLEPGVDADSASSTSSESSVIATAAVVILLSALCGLVVVMLCLLKRNKKEQYERNEKQIIVDAPPLPNVIPENPGGSKEFELTPPDYGTEAVVNEGNTN